MGSWQHSGWSSAEHVLHYVAGSHSIATVSGMAEQLPELADKTTVTATMGNGGLALSGPGAVEEWLAFNASVRRAGEWKDRLSFPSRGGLERGGDVLLSRGQARYPRTRRDDPPPRGWARYPRARRRRGARSRASAGSPRARRRSPCGSEGGADGPHCVRGPRVGLL